MQKNIIIMSTKQHPWQLQEFTKKKITQYKSIGVELVTMNLSSELNQSGEELRLFGKQELSDNADLGLRYFVLRYKIANFFEPYRIDHLPRH